MRLVLDEERLNGPRALRVSIRPPRQARLFPSGDMEHLLDAIELNCQLWGGATSPLVPLDSRFQIDELYRGRILGAAIDRIRGYSLRNLDPEMTFELPAVEPQFRDELAVTFLDATRKDTYRPITVITLDPADPWAPVYAACLGRLPEQPRSDLLEAANLIPDLTFEHFISVNRVAVQGSAADLYSRSSDTSVLHPRLASMVQLGYGLSPSTAIRSRNSALPSPDFEAFDAGPNVVVVCTPGDTSDIALLWNLRCAHGDEYGVPVGLLINDVTPEFIDSMLASEGISRQGISAHPLYVTSTSVSRAEIEVLIGTTSDSHRPVSIVEPSKLARFGPPPSRPRSEVSVWTEGSSTLIPGSSEDRTALFTKRPGFRNLELKVDVRVEDAPFPDADDFRGSSFNEELFAGSLTMNVGNSVMEGVTLQWPSRLLMLKALAQARGARVDSSEPGLACLTAMRSLDDPSELFLLCHAPLLRLLQTMANRQGTAWAKAHLRGDLADSPDITNQTAPHENDLPEIKFQQFKNALGSDKAARSWLDWAESHRFIVKGFPLDCESCRAKQWIPVAGFSPPVVCQGCARTIDRPFPSEFVHFRYRLGESMRRVFEHDAIGHLLALRYFASLFATFRSNLMIGAHPGINIYSLDDGLQLGEADLLALMTDGACIPMEVKRSFAGVLPEELDKLERLVGALKSPWSAVVVTDYARNAPEGFEDIEDRGKEGEPFRIVLTYDQLLDPIPHRSMGSDPYAWNPMGVKEISDREKLFTKQIAEFTKADFESSFEDELLYRPKPKVE